MTYSVTLSVEKTLGLRLDFEKISKNCDLGSEHHPPYCLSSIIKFVELIELMRMTRHGLAGGGLGGSLLWTRHTQNSPYSRRSPDSVFANIYFNANSYSSRSCLGLELQKFSKHLAAGFIFMAAGRAAAVFIGVMCAEFSCGTAGLAAAPRIASSHS